MKKLLLSVSLVLLVLLVLGGEYCLLTYEYEEAISAEFYVGGDTVTYTIATKDLLGNTICTHKETVKKSYLMNEHVKERYKIKHK